MEYIKRKPYWLENFQDHIYFRHTTLKKPRKDYMSSSYLDLSDIEVVSLEEFIKIEDDRIPLIHGMHMHFRPFLECWPGFFNGEKLIAVLAVSGTSGFMSGIKVYTIEKNQKSFKASEGNLIASF